MIWFHTRRNATLSEKNSFFSGEIAYFKSGSTPNYKSSLEYVEVDLGTLKYI